MIPLKDAFERMLEWTFEEYYAVFIFCTSPRWAYSNASLYSTIEITADI
jgi:hypothetical protein